MFSQMDGDHESPSTQEFQKDSTLAARVERIVHERKRWEVRQKAVLAKWAKANENKIRNEATLSEIREEHEKITEEKERWHAYCCSLQKEISTLGEELDEIKSKRAKYLIDVENDAMVNNKRSQTMFELFNRERCTKEMRKFEPKIESLKTELELLQEKLQDLTSLEESLVRQKATAQTSMKSVPDSSLQRFILNESRKSRNNLVMQLMVARGRLQKLLVETDANQQPASPESVGSPLI